MAGSKDRLDLAKRNSRAQVLLAIHKHGAISRVQLAKMTGQSTTNIGRIVDELLSEDVLVETGAVYGPRGRPMVLLTINPEGAPIGGIWFGPENIEIAIASPAGEILGYRAVSYDSGEKKPFAVIVAITQAIQKAVEALGKDFPRLHGVGVTVPGVVDPEEGTIISMPHRPEWDNVPIARLLRARLGVSVSVANDVSAAAAAAEWRNGKSQSGGELYVIVSSGISSVLVSDNGVLRGAHDAAGAIGHMIVDSQGPLCECGNRGCFQSLASDNAFIRKLWPSVENDSDTSEVSHTDYKINGLIGRNTNSIGGEGFYLEDNLNHGDGIGIGGGILPANLDISVDMSMGGDSIWCAGVAYRQTMQNTSNGSGYYTYFTPSGDTAVIVHATHDESRDIARVSIDPPVDFSVMHKLRIKAKGNLHEVWIDGEKIIEAVDNEVLEPGYAALVELNHDTYFGNWAYYDNLSIKLIDETGGAICGKVINAETKKPIRGVKIQLSTGQSTKSLADGSYTFTGLIPGSYGITVLDDALQSISYTINLDKDTTITQDFAVKSLQSAHVQASEADGTKVNMHRKEALRRGLEMAKRGDAKARSALESVVDYLGIGLANAVMMFDPHVVYICGDIIDLAPDFLPDLIRKKILQKLYSRFLGVEIRTKLDVRDFLLFGSVGLVLTQPFRILEEENRRVRSVAYLEPILWRRENDA